MLSSKHIRILELYMYATNYIFKSLNIISSFIENIKIYTFNIVVGSCWLSEDCPGFNGPNAAGNPRLLYVITQLTQLGGRDLLLKLGESWLDVLCRQKRQGHQLAHKLEDGVLFSISHLEEY